ncbi:MAG: cobalamin-dependent protein [Thermogutta sp.]
MAAFLSPKQLALASGISESTVKRWCDRGLLPTVRTPGGHRRIALGEALRVLRDQNTPLVRPELLGLPAFSAKTARTVQQSVDELTDALQEADADRCRIILLELRRLGFSVAEIGDAVVAPAFERIGQAWECGKLEIYRERAACGLFSEVLAELDRLLPDSPSDQPLAVGGSLSHDHYRVASQLVRLVFREKGWRALHLGAHLPPDTMVRAIHDLKPTVFWLSVSFVASADTLIAACRALFQAAKQENALLVVGGRGIEESLRQRLAYSAYCQDLIHLNMLLDTLPAPQLGQGARGSSDADRTQRAADPAADAD